MTQEAPEVESPVIVDIEPETPVDEGYGAIVESGVLALLLGFMNTVVAKGISRWGANGLVASLVSFLKVIPFTKNVKAPTLVFVVTGIIWLVGTIAVYFQFESTWVNSVSFLTVLFPAIVGFIDTQVNARNTHEKFVAHGLNTMIGYEKKS